MTPAAAFLAAPTPAPADPTTTYVLMAGAGLFIIYVMMRTSRKNKKGDTAAPFQAGRLAQQRQVEREMESLLVQLSDMCRQMTAQIDTRATKLEMLIADADERIDRLKAANAAAPPRPRFGEDDDAPAARPASRPAVSVRPAATAARPPAAERPSVPPPATNVDELADEPPAADPPQIEPPAADPPAEPDDPHAEVYRLADDGNDARAIAAELGRPRGEVELILALRPRA